MKSSKIILIIVSVSMSVTISAQTPMVTNTSELISFKKSDYNYLEEQESRYSLIEGTPYLEEEFVKGSLIYENKKYIDVLLRYNYYEGYFEYKTDKNIQYFDPELTKVDTVWYLDSKYIYLEYESGNTIKSDYMRLLNNGKTQILTQTKVIQLQAKPASGYNEAQAARFDPRPEVTFIRINNEPAKEFKGKKSIEDIFGDKESLMSAFVKKEKMKLRKEEEIIALCKYYDSLGE